MFALLSRVDSLSLLAMPLLWSRKKLLLTASLAALSSCAFSLLSAQTLQEQVDAAVAAFGEGDYAQAYWTFESIELDYGQEPEFLDPHFQSSVLPVRAYAALMADRPTGALVFFDELLRTHAPRDGVRAFAIYNYAIALSQVDALAAAAEAFRSFQQNFPDSNEAALAKLQEADLLYEIGELERANEQLDLFYESQAPAALRMQARLRALQIASESQDSKRSLKILFGTDWNVAAMPDIAVLSFAALDAGDVLLADGLFLEAIRAYRLTLPRDVLIEKQRERLASTRQNFSQQAAFASSIWKNHSAQVIARLERQLDRLENMDDYTPGLFLRSGQAYLLASRYREAAILFRTIALDTSYTNDIRAEAHYRWIIALNEAEQWEAARSTAEQFLSLHPKHPLANNALFLIARAYQGEGKFYDAIEVLDSLIANFPQDKQAPRWYFTRGYNYSVLEQQAKARENFETALSQYPKSELATQLELWAGLTYFFERNYDESLKRLLDLKKRSQKHPMYPEINYRIANLYYAQRDYENALKTIDYVIKNFSDHTRYGETLALKGDIYMGLGELAQAAVAFRQVPSDEPRIYDYAVFQASKIYKALERYDLMRTHLQSYVDRPDANERPRVSEALYWIGWSLQQEDRAAEAFPLYEEALARFGNDPQARAVSSILSAYADLFKRAQNDADVSFETWLQETGEQSLKDNQLTWFARLTLFTAHRQRRMIDDATADATLLSIHRLVPIEQQDPESLAEVGIVLVERGYESSDDYFEQILNEFPKRFERAAAFYGKAKLAAKNQRLDEARRWLIRFLEETPTHPLAADARLLAADILIRQGVYAAAREALNEILQLKEMRGRPHARALAGLARIETEQDNAKRAIPYWQRIYTLYRAYPEIVVEAYWESAQLFEEIDDPVAARNTLAELLRDDRLKVFPQYAQAEAELPRLEEAARARNALVEQKAAMEQEVKL
ncbi:tetratricopeptide repeat protein [Coraliomargarita algicola]|uniref:Tetratricopeptide repeat protein n=1 Tax=Coraliomargarita algicola TaxID=3092156 RepID=A0ABZ0RGL9_9BACT|nr:tetratricopeptide repeat protein [Coraliomargarita sp. J2-16]WPJ94374.1 tetratricopeptide repeat protein [Coraliomargarita sp. J2-16]